MASPLLPCRTSAPPVCGGRVRGAPSRAIIRASSVVAARRAPCTAPPAPVPRARKCVAGRRTIPGRAARGQPRYSTSRPSSTASAAAPRAGRGRTRAASGSPASSKQSPASPDDAAESPIEELLVAIDGTQGGRAASPQLRQRVEELIRRVEEMDRRPESETAKAQLLDGAWEVRYTTAPPPSNGQLGPFGGVAVQRIDMSNTAYVNELSIPSPEKPWLTARLQATWDVLDERTWKVQFQSIRLALGSFVLMNQSFENTTRIWVTTYLSESLRIVRAGRTMDAVEAERGRGRAVNGVADDSVFVMTKAD